MEKVLIKKRIDRKIKILTEGVYAISSWRCLAYVLLPKLIFICGMLCLPLLISSLAWQKILVISLIFSLLALVYDFLANFVGIVCLGGAFFIGVGGYLSGLLNLSLNWPLILTIPTATIIGAMICTIFLIPCLSIKGIYFAIVSLMYPLLFGRIIQALDIFGGTDGLPGLNTFPNIWVELYIIIPITLIFTFLLRKLINEDFGVVLRAIRDNEQAVIASNININWYKTLSVFISSIIGCFAGAFLAHLYGWVGLSLFALDFSIFPIAATVVGGGGTLIGPIIGSLILAPLSEMLRTFGPLRVVFYSLILAGLVIYKTEGIIPFLEKNIIK